MTIAVTFADAEAATRTVLLNALASRSEVYKPATITNKFPTSALTGNATHLQVEVDGTPTFSTYPVTKRTTVRVTAYSAPTNQDNAKNLHNLAAALLSAHPGDADTFGFVVLTGDLKAVDSATKNNLVSFTARVNLRPTALA